MKKFLLFVVVFLYATTANGQLTLPPGASTYVDLGLPSGTQWKIEDESGYYSYDDALRTFGYKLPTKAQINELATYCNFVWNSGIGCQVIGPNGNSIFIPAKGTLSSNGEISNAGLTCLYWTQTSGDKDYWAWSLLINRGGAEVYGQNKACRSGVRLVLKPSR